MHRAAEASREAHVLGKKLAGYTEHEEITGDILGGLAGGVLLYYFVVLAAVEFFHYLDELFVRKLADGGKTLGYNLVMAAVGTENEVINTEGEGLTYSGSFLTDSKVRGAGIGELFAVVFALELNALEHRLEFTDCYHIGIHSEEFFLGEVVLFVLNGLVVFANRNILEGYSTLCKFVLGTDVH